MWNFNSIVKYPYGYCWRESFNGRVMHYHCPLSNEERSREAIDKGHIEIYTESRISIHSNCWCKGGEREGLIELFVPCWRSHAIIFYWSILYTYILGLLIYNKMVLLGSSWGQTYSNWSIYLTHLIIMVFEL